MAVSAKEITEVLLYDLWRRNRVAVIANWYVFHWHEADVFSITNSLYGHEIEVKISRSDYARDFREKRYKHLVLAGELPAGSKTVPRTFSFATPPGLVKVDDVPEYAGLIYVDMEAEKSWDQITVIKKAPVLRQARKLSEDQFKSLLKRYTWTYMHNRTTQHNAPLHPNS